jgi:SAM-dependent methyltransferase
MKNTESYEIFFGSKKPDGVSLESRRRKLTDWINRYASGPEKRVLDLGCWAGDFLRLLPRSWEKWGIDLHRHAELPPEVHFMPANLEDGFPALPGTFDLVFAGEIIEHILATQAFLGGCYQVLKPNGLFILTTPNLGCWLNLWRWCNLGQPYCVNSDVNQDGHVRYLAATTLQDSLREAGFQLLEMTSVGGLEFLKSLPWLYYLIFKIFKMRGKTLLSLSLKPAMERE